VERQTDRQRSPDTDRERERQRDLFVNQVMGLDGYLKLFIGWDDVNLHRRVSSGETKVVLLVEVLVYFDLSESSQVREDLRPNNGAVLADASCEDNGIQW
jgi:hypothetical protein